MWKGHTSRSSKLKKDDGSTVAVAINDDKTSQSALKWAADHLLAKGQSFYLLHVRKKVTTITTPTGQQLPIDSVDEESLALFKQQRERQTKELLAPFQVFCGRRLVTPKEVVLEDTDVPKAIIDFVVDQSVDKLVLGASSRNAFTRTFKQADVPTSVSKLAPDFVSIYVINKGKISSIRPAPCPNKRPPPKQTSQKCETTGNQYQSAKSEPTPRLPEPVELTRDQRRMEPGKGSGAVPTAYNGILANERLNMIINQQEVQGTYNHDLLYKSVSSCPSPTRSSFEYQPFNSTNINVKDQRGGEIGVQGGLRLVLPNGQLGEQQMRYGDQYEERSAINDQWNRGPVQGSNSWSSSTSNTSINESSYARGAPSLPQAYGSTGYSPPASQKFFGGYSPPASQNFFGGYSPPVSQHAFGGYSPPVSQQSFGGHSPPVSQQSFGGHSPPVSQQSFGGHSPPVSKQSFGGHSPPVSKQSFGGHSPLVSQHAFENGYSPRFSRGSHGNGSSRGSHGNGSSRGFNNTEEMNAEMKMIRIKIQQLTKETYGNPGMDAADAKMKSIEFASQEAAEAERRFSRGSKNEQMGGRSNREPLHAAADQSTMQKSEMMATRNSKSSGSNKTNMSRGNLQQTSIYDGVTAGVRYRRYSMEEIEKATDNFSEALKIGEGGYGPVFKSTLDHTLVAIKILHSDVAQGMRQFQQEVEVLSSIRHPNMVLLMGACPDIGALVYEFMSNGSLDDRLFCRGNTLPLPWRLRFRIAAEIATGLLFLHQNKPEPLVHRDLKPGNILLDNNFVCKIADVGLARLIPPSVADSVTQYRMTAAAGTFCYIDPEYQMTGMLGIKSDIYALGIILLQLVSGKPPMGLAKNMEDAIEMDRFENMLDPSVPDWPVPEALRFAKLSLRCAELRRKDRPDLGTVVLPELNRLRAVAADSPSSSSTRRHFQHANTWNRQTVSTGHSAGDAGYASNSSDQGRAFSASAVRTPMLGSPRHRER